jgi:hypothetical protein
MEYTEKSIYAVIYTKLYYGEIWLKIDIAQQLIVKIPHIEFEDYPLNNTGAYPRPWTDEPTDMISI